MAEKNSGLFSGVLSAYGDYEVQKEQLQEQIANLSRKMENGGNQSDVSKSGSAPSEGKGESKSTLVTRKTSKK